MADYVVVVVGPEFCLVPSFLAFAGVEEDFLSFFGTFVVPLICSEVPGMTN